MSFIFIILFMIYDEPFWKLITQRLLKMFPKSLRVSLNDPRS